MRRRRTEQSVDGKEPIFEEAKASQIITDLHRYNINRLDKQGKILFKSETLVYTQLQCQHGLFVYNRLDFFNLHAFNSPNAQCFHRDI